VVTIHDTSFLRFPEFAEPRNLRYLTARIRETAARADAVITDSRFSAGEIRERLPVQPERLFPIHLGVSPAFCSEPSPTVDETLRALQLTRPYLLTVGTLEPRKNIPFLIEVFERMTGFDGTWVLAGMRGWKYEPILERIIRSPRSDRIRLLDYVSDAQLPALYAGAELFLFASVYEGFGLPPLEAMACGTPVIASRRGAMPEVLGPAAVLLDAFDADLWAERAGRLLADPAERAERIERGCRRAAQYTWRETARRTWEVYREVAR
jgi:glycosyltransferase involved in cell wall biosynthesis